MAPRHLNGALEELTRRLMREPRNPARRTNAGGWHYAFDFFKLDEPVVAEFRDLMEQRVQGYLNYPNYFRPAGQKKKDTFRLEG